MKTARTLYDKFIDEHTVCNLDDQGHVLLYIDRQVANEYTSPQAFTGLREAGRKVWQPKATLGVVDHVNPTTPERTSSIADKSARRQVSYFGENCEKFGIELIDILDERQGIEHVVAPEQGYILPGMVVAAGDSHTTTYGALGAFGFGIGTSEIEHLLATQTLVYKRLKSMHVTFEGDLPRGLSSKDMIMALIGKIGAAGANDFAIEFSGSAILALSVEARMTICNMAVEAGARGAFVAPDEKVYDYLREKPRSPKGALWNQAVDKWRELYSDSNATFDQDITLSVDALEPQVTWGTSPDQVSSIAHHTPNHDLHDDPERAKGVERALTYMGLAHEFPLEGLPISHAFIGSCTNSRIEDLREAAQVIQNNTVAKHVRAIIVPGSTPVRKQAEEEGLAQIFMEAGFEWRQSGCSMCLAMNDDVLRPGDRCASSTNRNFEGRQGAGARTHLMSPQMVAAAAIRGHLTDVRSLLEE